MPDVQNNIYSDEYLSFINQKDFPCVVAKTALTFNQLHYMVVDHLACPKDDTDILEFIYDFVDTYRQAEKPYHSAAIIFKGPTVPDEVLFEELFWQRMQALSNLDAQRYGYDRRVVADPNSANFSFSLKEEAFFVIGLHPGSSRPARRFKYPTLVFNAHAQFEQLRTNGRYDTIRNTIRTRDIAYSGSVNPMLHDFGDSSEAYQYSGKAYDQAWKCPFLSQHGSIDHHTAA
ncbi:guanitoxin biosynthesis heme-dependent pre-guanitoxin N-hydroxylase GntA [Hymenobacter sp. YC55]|uniref:guanitoxin biosynthesis heme-dependent pre-guanitoxin N-hydroxylase GntA n=1 Tax=Hymenobacter sp. YC55 TaxID=3034019 RepID=UPI0023F6E97E|nr:guanitoxin biosynthesis heme-dependent pre-guanitoxin N-hydroxylase GntA [Hymenobacter sp. YC55]MDF7814744.1 guanitoxin biosynthesis heme-dependent pre-guanitoxin N-hydroxylase GntA [Hymenobacter sp. YC55]